MYIGCIEEQPMPISILFLLRLTKDTREISRFEVKDLQKYGIL